ncbi:LytTR family DNA-binding domain-containing protein [Levilactobacillus namurensis]|uniref:LytTR family DNA-binding domain-containing protein n=1 Tax=Levilactobacillus namurensis TaxID=380393 RepID=UPI00222F4716|nr:LytTR family DNA-binding domain-containing protein [Levilactobacillus namurensis]MCW3777301.1 LytTR family transcriptional regulator [Levilactobacillus namurensis]MDT7018633.1 LytTR family DNA-binding domain-containing protein [Levilactobacillus namurensis]WNN64388.1 LytTR family DNA-binding domain-containing protein [Levilactobacillus namurensis]
MKINFHIDPKLKAEHADFWLRELTDHLATIITQLNQKNEVLWCYQDNEIRPVAYADIVVLQAVGNRIQVDTTDKTYAYHARLAHVIDQLPAEFIEASRGTVINYQKIDHLELLGNGKIDVLMINQQRVQMSRRKIKNLKEKLGI